MDGIPREMALGVLYEVATLRPIPSTTRAERLQILHDAGYNTELVPQTAVYVDLKTDSGVGARITAQVASRLEGGAIEAAPELTGEAHTGLQRLAARFRELFGFPFVLACNQGRAAERIWCKLHVTAESLVPGNMLFPSMRYHVSANGGQFVELPCAEAYDLAGDAPFKANMDIGGLSRLVEEAGAKRIPFVCVELCNNACGGHPVSLAHLEQVRQLLAPRKIPLLIDASRILENSQLLKEREPGLAHDSLPDIVRKTCAAADALTLSAQKDFGVQAGGFLAMRDEKAYQSANLQAFLDGVQAESSAMAAIETALAEHLRTDAYTRSRVAQVRYLWQRLREAGVPVLNPAGGHAVYLDVARFLPHLAEDDHPAEALAAFVYGLSGIRIAKGPPPTAGQKERGTNLIRMALPANRYLKEHLDHIAAALAAAFEQRMHIPGLARGETPNRGKYAPPLFTPTTS